jgi:class 3 adenylate cyclase
MTTATEGSNVPTHISRPDPAEALLLGRELAGLTTLTAVRGVVIAILFLMTLAVGFSGFENVAVGVVTLVYGLALTLCAFLIRRRTHLGFVGYLGVALDTFVVGVLPAIWYHSVGGADVAPAFMLKTGLTAIAALLIVLNSLAMRPAYPLLVALGVVIVHLGYFIFIASDDRTVVTANYVQSALGPHFHGGQFAGTLIVIAGIGSILTFLTWRARRLIYEAVGLEKANAQLGRYFSPNLVRRLVDNPNLLHLGGERRELSFVFTDLTGFTSLVEKQEPDVVVPLLNEYLDAMVSIVFKHDGTVDKFVGDAIHVIFGAPIHQLDHAARAVACALEMDAFAHAFAGRKREAGIPLGETRIGINTGTVVVGNFGGDSMFDYTAHGDAINTAARLESLNKHLGTRIAVSASVVEQIPDFAGRPAGTFILQGKSGELEVFEPLSPEEADSSRVKAYVEAYRMLEGEHAGAGAAFERLANSPHPDPLADFHLHRIRSGESGTTVRMTEK